MSNGNFFVVYYLASFVGFAAIGLILLINKIIHGKYSIKNNFLLFIIATLLIGVLYFMEGFYLNEYIERDGRSALERVLDVGLYCAQMLFFLRYQREEMKFCEARLARFTDAAIIVILCLSTITYGFFMDGYYYVANSGLRTVTLIVQLLFILLMTGLTILYSILCFKRIDLPLTRGFCIASNAIVMVNGFWNGIFAVLLMTDREDHFGWNFGDYDFTAAFLLVLNVLAVIYIYKKDFKEINKNKLKDAGSREERIEALFSGHNLTAREKEIAGLLLEAYSYESIAQELCISKHTVKRHVHNIYEKLEISTKIDLIKLVED